MSHDLAHIVDVDRSHRCIFVDIDRFAAWLCGGNTVDRCAADIDHLFTSVMEFTTAIPPNENLHIPGVECAQYSTEVRRLTSQVAVSGG